MMCNRTGRWQIMKLCALSTIDIELQYTPDVWTQWQCLSSLPLNRRVHHIAVWNCIKTRPGKEGEKGALVNKITFVNFFKYYSKFFIPLHKFKIFCFHDEFAHALDQLSKNLVLSLNHQNARFIQLCSNLDITALKCYASQYPPTCNKCNFSWPCNTSPNALPCIFLD